MDPLHLRPLLLTSSNTTLSVFTDRSVCVLNQSAAAYLFPRQQAVGQYVRGTDEERFPQPVVCRVVGIAQDAKFANLQCCA
jgi:hypothetical protein